MEKMEINETITLLKDTLSTLDNSLPVKLADFQTNESELREHMLTVLSEIQQYFVDKDVSELRSLHLCLLVNTLSGITDLLEKDGSIGHIVGFIPRLNLSLYIRCVLDLDLLGFVQETLEQAPIQMMTELLQCVAEEREHLNDTDACRLNEKVLNGCVIRMKFCECKFVRYELYEYFKTSMKFYKSGNNTEWLTFPPETDDDYDTVSVGYYILSLGSIMFNILKVIVNPIQAEFLDIYDIRLTSDSSSRELPSDIDTKQMLSECLGIVFMNYKFFSNKLNQNSLILLHQTSYKQNTIGNAIGEISECCSQLLDDIMKPSDCVIPSDLQEFLNICLTTTPGARDDIHFEEEYWKKQIQFSTTHESNWFVLNCIRNFLGAEKSRMDFVSRAALIMELCSKERSTETSESDVKQILNALEKSTLDDLIPFLSTFVEKFGFDTVLSREKIAISDFLQNLIEDYSDDDACNESSSNRKDDIFKQLVISAFQAPEYLLSKLLVQAIKKPHKLNEFTQLFNMLKPACLYIPEYAENTHKLSLLTLTMVKFFRFRYKKLSKNEKNALTNLLINFFQQKFIPSDDFLAYCLLPGLYIRDDQDLDTVEDLISLFEGFVLFFFKNSKISLVIILVQFAQLLDQSRWTIDTFSVKRSKIYPKIISLFKVILDSFLSMEVLWRDERWLLSHVQKFSLITKSYFYKIASLNKYTSIEWQFLSLIHKPLDNYPYIKELYKNKPSEIIIPLSQLLPSIESNEIETMAKNFFNGVCEQSLFILDVFTMALTMTCNIARQNCDTGEIDEARSKRMFLCLGQKIFTILSIIENFKRNPGCVQMQMQSYFLTYILRLAVAVKCFPESNHIYQYAIMKSIECLLYSLPWISDNYESGATQICIGLFVI